MSQNINNLDNGIDLKELILFLWSRKKILTIATSIFAVLSVIYALSLPNIYTSKVLVAPVDTNESLSSKLNSLGPIASFSPIRLSNENTRANESIERIKSFSFFSEHFLPNIKLENLMAVADWKKDGNIIKYNESLYDPSKKTWSKKITTQKAYREYRKILNIRQDKTTYFYTFSINHKSPIIAKEWIDIIVYNINESMRSIDIKNAQNSINYLNETYQSTNLQALKDASTQLIENQMQTLMLASSSSSYIFKIIDAAIVPENKSEPSRSLICIIGTFLGAIISISWLLVRRYLMQ